jgi:hypothetical protein
MLEDFTYLYLMACPLHIQFKQKLHKQYGWDKVCKCSIDFHNVQSDHFICEIMKTVNTFCKRELRTWNSEVTFFVV